MPRGEEKTGYSQKRLRDKVKDVADAVVQPVSGYELKRPAIFDFYEGEWYGLDFDYLKDLNPLRVVWQATFGWRGRHWNGKMDYGVSAFVEKAHQKGIKYGLYHLMLPTKPMAQADFYCRAVDSLGGLGDMMPILDVERTDVRGKGWANDVKAWLDIVTARYGKRPLIYTSKYYWSFLNYGQYVDGKKVLLPPPWTVDYMGWFAGYPWVPYLDSNALMPKTYQAWGFNHWAAWQYYDKGRSFPPRGYPKRPTFPANDLNLASPWFQQYLEEYHA